MASESFLFFYLRVKNTAEVLKEAMKCLSTVQQETGYLNVLATELQFIAHHPPDEEGLDGMISILTLQSLEPPNEWRLVGTPRSIQVQPSRLFEVMENADQNRAIYMLGSNGEDWVTFFFCNNENDKLELYAELELEAKYNPPIYKEVQSQSGRKTKQDVLLEFEAQTFYSCITPIHLLDGAARARIKATTVEIEGVRRKDLRIKFDDNLLKDCRIHGVAKAKTIDVCFNASHLHLPPSNVLQKWVTMRLKRIPDRAANEYYVYSLVCPLKSLGNLEYFFKKVAQMDEGSGSLKIVDASADISARTKIPPEKGSSPGTNIEDCMEALGKLDRIPNHTYGKALEKFKDRDWREMFIYMPEDRKMAFLNSL